MTAKRSGALEAGILLILGIDRFLDMDAPWQTSWAIALPPPSSQSGKANWSRHAAWTRRVSCWRLSPQRCRNMKILSKLFGAALSLMLLASVSAEAKPRRHRRDWWHDRWRPGEYRTGRLHVGRVRRAAADRCCAAD